MHRIPQPESLDAAIMCKKLDCVCPCCGLIQSMRVERIFLVTAKVGYKAGYAIIPCKEHNEVLKSVRRF